MKRLIPKYQNSPGALIAPSDNTYVTIPYVEERIPYTLPQHQWTYISSPKPDFRTQTEKDRDRRVAESEDNARKTEEGARKAEALIKFTLPSTYVGPLFREGSYWDNLSSGEGTGNSFGNLVLDMFGYSLPSMGRKAMGRTVRRNVARNASKTTEETSQQGIQEINNFSKKYIGKLPDENGKWLEFNQTPDFNFLLNRYNTEDPYIAIFPTKENSLYRYSDWLKKRFNVEPDPKDLNAEIRTSKHFEGPDIGYYDPDTKATELNAKEILDPEVFLSTYLHEAVSHGSDASALSKTLRELGFTESMLKMGAFDKSRLTLDSSVEDLLRETIRQVPNSKNILTKDGYEGLQEALEFRALLQETRKKIWDAAGGDDKKFNEMVDKMIAHDIIQYMPKYSGYTEQFERMMGNAYQYRPTGVYKYLVNGGLTKRLKDILKYVPTVMVPMAVTRQEQDDDNGL